MLKHVCDASNEMVGCVVEDVDLNFCNIRHMKVHMIFVKTEETGKKKTKKKTNTKTEGHLSF